MGHFHPRGLLIAILDQQAGGDQFFEHALEAGGLGREEGVLQVGKRDAQPRVQGRVIGNGDEVASVEAAAAAGDLSAVVCHVADWLAAFGERLRAGDRIICGSLAPPIWVKAGDRVRVDLGPLGAVEVALTA